MAAVQVVIGFFVIGILFVMQVVGSATPYWLSLKVLGKEIFHAGLFKVCYVDSSGLAKTIIGDGSLCRQISDLDSLKSYHYYGIVVMECLSVLLFFIGSIVGLIGCCSSGNSGRNYVLHMARLATSAAIFSLAGVIWFVAEYYDKTKFIGVVTSVISINLHYSFALCAASSAIGIVYGIVMCVVGSNMDPPTVGVVSQPAAGQQVMVVHTQNPLQMPAYNPGGYAMQTVSVQ